MKLTNQTKLISDEKEDNNITLRKSLHSIRQSLSPNHSPTNSQHLKFNFQFPSDYNKIFSFNTKRDFFQSKYLNTIDHYDNYKEKSNTSKEFQELNCSFNDENSNSNNCIPKQKKGKDVYNEDSVIINVAELNSRIKELEEENTNLNTKYLFFIIRLG